MNTSMTNGNGLRVALERNNIFYGKMLGEEELRKEQEYFENKIRLINRLVLGSGVVCGLGVSLDDRDGGQTVTVESGLAIDGWGRFITVPEDIRIDATQPTDDQGNPVGPPLEEGVVEICLAYVEHLVDLVPVFIPKCDTPGNCAPNTIREGYRLIVRQVRDEDRSPFWPSCSLDEFPLPVDERLHELLCQRISRGCPESEANPCVPLARVTLPLNEDGIDVCGNRPLVYNNALLFELILCLADRLVVASQGFRLGIVSGDGQSGPPGETLPERLVVIVEDDQGQPMNDVVVQFRGDGRQEPMTTRTDEEGLAQTRWTLDEEPGEQQLIARAAGSSDRVIFQARAIGR